MIDPQLAEYQRSLVFMSNGKLDIDLDNLDLSRQLDQSLIPDFTPKVTLEPFQNLTRMAFDIETTGLDPEVDKVKAIGVVVRDSQDTRYHFFVNGKDTQGLAKKRNIKFYSCEVDLLLEFFRWYSRFKNIGKSLKIEMQYNGFIFDIPFLEERAQQLGISRLFPWWKAGWLTKDATAQVWGKPITDRKVAKQGEIGYYSYYRKPFNCVDLMHKVYSYDFVARKLSSYSLKNVVYELDIIEETRTELTYEQMLECYASNDWRLLLTYLKDDLKATLELGDFLLPAYYYQLEYAPWVPLQSLFTRGNGSKWNDIILSEYISDQLTYSVGSKSDKGKVDNTKLAWRKTKDFEPQKTTKYEGGKTGGTAGLFFNVGKLDVASLYPSIMLMYGISGVKDTQDKQLAILKYAREKRLFLKAVKSLNKDVFALAKKGKLSEDTGSKFLENEDDINSLLDNYPNYSELIKEYSVLSPTDANIRQAGDKVIINSGYGVLGTTGISFNDYVAACLVTGYGRKILDKMAEALESIGATCIELDTDGIFFSYDGDHNYALEVTQNAMPKGINLENELVAKAVYIPPYDIPTDFVSGLKPLNQPGLKKNYIIIKDFDKSPKVSGKFRNRSTPKIYKEYLPELIKRVSKVALETDDKQKIKGVIWDTLNEYKSRLKGKEYDLDWLSVTRKVKKNERHNDRVLLYNNRTLQRLSLGSKQACELIEGEPIDYKMGEYFVNCGDYFLDDTGWGYFSLDSFGNMIVKYAYAQKPTKKGDRYSKNQSYYTHEIFSNDVYEFYKRKLHEFTELACVYILGEYLAPSESLDFDKFLNKKSFRERVLKA